MPRLPENPAFVLLSKGSEDGDRLSLRRDGKGGYEVIAVSALGPQVFLTGVTRDDLIRTRDFLRAEIDATDDWQPTDATKVALATGDRALAMLKGFEPGVKLGGIPKPSPQREGESDADYAERIRAETERLAAGLPITSSDEAN